jgi:hypothetical protein
MSSTGLLVAKAGSVYFPFWDMIFNNPPLACYQCAGQIEGALIYSCIIHTIGDSHVKPFYLPLSLSSAPHLAGNGTQPDQAGKLTKSRISGPFPKKVE